MNYPSRAERLDIRTIDITPQFMRALTYSNSVLCHALLEAIRDWNNLPHNVVEIEDDAKFRKSLLFTIF